jgi:hypothetical protein
MRDRMQTAATEISTDAIITAGIHAADAAPTAPVTPTNASRQSGHFGVSARIAGQTRNNVALRRIGIARC